MADIKIPAEIITWMNAQNWGQHHLQYHVTKRWDRWHQAAARGETNAQQVVRLIQQNQWPRESIQEGEAGDGLEFLAMHRAMMILISENFPQHATMLTGWATPPTDPQDAADPVPGGAPFDPFKLEGIRFIENQPDFFALEDHFGLFIQTTFNPAPGIPDQVRADKRYGVHNYLHGRWTDTASPVNLGNPLVNLFNSRFWKLHGWIDKVWTKFREAQGLSNEDTSYKALIQHYKQMMSGHHHHLSHTAKVLLPRKFPLALQNFFQEN